MKIKNSVAQKCLLKHLRIMIEDTKVGFEACFDGDIEMITKYAKQVQAQKKVTA